MEYTFLLLDNKWNDGTDSSADDIVATFQCIIFPPNGVVSIRKALRTGASGRTAKSRRTTSKSFERVTAQRNTIR